MPPLNASSRPLSVVEGCDDVATVVTATCVEDHEFTPFDALSLVESNGDPIVSSDDASADVTSRLDLQSVTEE